MSQKRFRRSSAANFLENFPTFFVKPLLLAAFTQATKFKYAGTLQVSDSANNSSVRVLYG